MKITKSYLKRIIKEEVQAVLKEQEGSLFSPEDGEINKQVLTSLYTKAESGDKQAAQALYAAAPLLFKKGEKFSPADGTPINQDAIAKAYGLNTGNAQKDPDYKQQIQDIYNDAMARQSKNDEQMQQMMQQMKDEMAKNKAIRSKGKSDSDAKIAQMRDEYEKKSAQRRAEFEKMRNSK